MHVPRRFPRLVFDTPAEVEVTAPVAQRRLRRSVRVPATIRSLSCEGAGLQLGLGAATLNLIAGASVMLRFTAEESQLELPGLVAWCHTSKGEQHVGVRLQLELARAFARHTYATWIVALTRARMQPPGR